VATSLRELNLEDNCIASALGLAVLTGLTRLELGGNRLTSLSPLSSLTGLCHLSVEDNGLTSLGGLEALTSLLELYAANNGAGTMRDLQRVRCLPRLIILDLSGNPCCEIEDYRSVVLYLGRRLKVLDGRTVEAAEQGAARAKYAGRLTTDFLVEQLGHSAFASIRTCVPTSLFFLLLLLCGGGGDCARPLPPPTASHAPRARSLPQAPRNTLFAEPSLPSLQTSPPPRRLDLSNLRIRDLGTAFAAGFEALQHLVLDGNQLATVACLTHLQHLRSLKAAGNKLCDESAFAFGPLLGDGDVPPLPSLDTLVLSGNGITSLASLNLHRLRGLTALMLSNNEIPTLSGLDGLTALHELSLDANKIR
jgi:Leucine-rich repeat (LRR) protein